MVMSGTTSFSVQTDRPSPHPNDVVWTLASSASRTGETAENGETAFKHDHSGLV
jgi:hypothetical protein